jgi:lipoprotein-releasing system permease protein
LKLPFIIALRYLFSKKSTNAINIISKVSMGGMGIGAFALIVVLAVYNGFENLVLNLQNSFYPDIEISASEGKTFELNDTLEQQLNDLEGIELISYSLQENAYLRYQENSVIATVKGVDEHFFDVNNIDDYIVVGSSKLQENSIYYGILGAGIDYQLNTNIVKALDPITISFPKKGKPSGIIATQLFNSGKVMPGGVFAIQNDFDYKYFFIPIELMQSISQENKNIFSGIEIKAKSGFGLNPMKQALEEKLGGAFSVTTRFEQDEALYRIMKIEKYATVAILGLILLIISFNIVGSLSMLAMEKKKDITILKSMGADSLTIRMIFLLNGSLGSILGAGIGLVLGLLLVFAQSAFGLVKLGGNGGFVVEAYPVIVLWSDIFMAFFMIVIISLLAAWYPAKKAAKQSISFG